MSAPRLAAGLWVGALLRRVGAAGDFATIVHRGDAVAGSVVLIHRARDGSVRALARVVGPDGEYNWRTAASGDAVDSWILRQRGFDTDLWVVELDTSDPARFVDEMID